MTKKEKQIVDSLPSYEELIEMINEKKDLYKKYQDLSEDASTPKPIREHYKEYRLPHIEESINNLQFAANMYIKGYVMARVEDKIEEETKVYKDTPEELLRKALFDDKD